jgi:type IV pilus assembly protein PilP
MKRLMLGVAMLVSACGNQTDSVHDFVARAGEGMRGQVAPLPPTAAYAPAAYTAAELRDPFTLHAPVPPMEPDLRPREQLEAYPLDALRMLGTIQKDGSRFALIRTPDGLLHQVGTGRYLGLNSGRVAAIDPGAITLVETVIEDGEKAQRAVRLVLADAS